MAGKHNSRNMCSSFFNDQTLPPFVLLLHACIVCYHRFMFMLINQLKPKIADWFWLTCLWLIRWKVMKCSPIASGLATNDDTSMQRRAPPKLHLYATEEVASGLGIKQMYILNMDLFFPPVRPLVSPRGPASKPTQTEHLNKVTTAFKGNVHFFI